MRLTEASMEPRPARLLNPAWFHLQIILWAGLALLLIGATLALTVTPAWASEPTLICPLPEVATLPAEDMAAAPDAPRLLRQSLSSQAARQSIKTVLRQPPFSNPEPVSANSPYLAAEHFLRLRALPVSVADSYASLADPREQAQTLLLLDSRKSMTAGQVDALLAWVESGGRLIVAAEQLWMPAHERSGDLLLDRLGVQYYLTRDIKAQDRQQAIAQSGLPVPLAPAPYQAPAMPWPELTRLYLENEQAPAYMSFDPDLHLEDPDDNAHSWANSAQATHLLQIQRGAGTITVLSDAQLWQAPAIGRYDNAWLLWYLTQHSAVTMVIPSRHENLLALLVRQFPLALAASALLLVLALWRHASRTGPVRPAAARARSQPGEHARARANFVVRRGGRQALLRNLQQDILRRARQRHPGFEHLVVVEQWQVLARLSRQSTGFVSDALRPRPAQRLSRADFTHQVARLQTLRNSL